jgi:hypothetical protein
VRIPAEISTGEGAASKVDQGADPSAVTKTVQKKDWQR